MDKQSEAARREAIRRGQISAIQVPFNLEAGETAFAQFKAERHAIVSDTTSITKKQGVAGRAVLGGILLGGVGALAGAATAGSKTTNKTTEKDQIIDKGDLVLTDRRFMFVGSQVLSITHEQVADVSTKSSVASLIGIPDVIIRHPQMLKGEYYRLSGPDAKIALDYCSGVKAMRR